MNHYNTLGVSESATADEIKRAYKKLARKWHPDVNRDNPKAEEKFKEISAAYAVLGDNDKRTQYDNERKMPSMGGFSGFSGFGGFGSFDPFNMGTDPFEFLKRNAKTGNGLNIHTALTISFLDAKASQTQPISFLRNKPCGKCNGTGAQDYHAGNCPTCRGQGSIAQSLGGVLRAQSICQTCRGRGKLIKNKCGHCDSGSVRETAEINVHIPAGIISGKTLRLQGEGHRSAQGKGDLFIKIETAPDSRWNRDGANVFSSVEIDFPTLVMGGKVEVETIWGKELVTIPEKTQAGTKLALANKGFPRLNRMLASERGVHYVTASLKIPKGKLSKQQRDLLQKYKECFE